MDYITDLVESNAGALGINHVGYGDEQLIPAFPAIMVIAGEERRTLDGGTTTHFKKIYPMDIWVYHGRMDKNHKVRSIEDMNLATGIKNLLHNNYNLGGGIIFGYVTGNTPGVMVRNKVSIIGTRLEWEGEGREAIRGV